MTELQQHLLTQVLNNLKEKDAVVFQHGDCIGADAQAHNIACNLKFKIYVHPPTNSKYRAFCKNISLKFPACDYLIRNNNIVKTSDIMIATPEQNNEQLRSGTWATIRYAKKENKPIYILYPNGTMQLRG